MPKLKTAATTVGLVMIGFALYERFGRNIAQRLLPSS